jgi:transcription factor IIIB subunit 2
MFKIAEVFKIFSSQIFVKDVDIPIIDPSLFIDRFCSKLEFGDKFQQVKDTAIRLIQSMNRSWMTTGRRPNGLCGAAILISAKIHGFRRTPAQIVKAVHVCEETIRKRLGEFKSTNTAKLTRAELKEIESAEKDPYEFKIEEVCFEPPAITKR